MNKSRKSFSEVLPPPEREIHVFSYFKLHSLQAAIGSFAEFPKVRSSGSLRSY